MPTEITYPCPHGAQVFCGVCETSLARHITPVSAPHPINSVFEGRKVVGGRIDAIRQICRKYSAPEQSFLDDRQWLAQTILNILDGNIDDQFTESAS